MKLNKVLIKILIFLNFLFFRNKGMSLSNSVSFRQGSNVEFAGPAFVNTGSGGGDGKPGGQDEVII